MCHLDRPTPLFMSTLQTDVSSRPKSRPGGTQWRDLYFLCFSLSPLTSQPMLTTLHQLRQQLPIPSPQASRNPCRIASEGGIRPNTKGLKSLCFHSGTEPPLGGRVNLKITRRKRGNWDPDFVFLILIEQNDIALVFEIAVEALFNLNRRRTLAVILKCDGYGMVGGQK